MLADDLKVKIKEYTSKLEGVESAADLPALRARVEELKKEQRIPISTST